jgi:signal transduction histidine kinase
LRALEEEFSVTSVLEDFIISNRETIIARSRARVTSRTSPGPTEARTTNRVSVFLDQIVDALHRAKVSDAGEHALVGSGAARPASDRLQMGLSAGHVVREYGDVCQVVVALAAQQQLAVSAEESRVLGVCLEAAIAEAMTEWGEQRESALHAQGTERLGLFAHELRNLLSTGMLAYENLKRGQVGIGGGTGQLLGRTLAGLRDLIDRSLADVRLDAGIGRIEATPVVDFLAEIQIAAAMQAQARGLHFKASPFEGDVLIEGDRQILTAAMANLLQNAFKFTSKGGSVSLTTRLTRTRVLFEVEDECGGLPPGKAEELFVPYSQRSDDRSGIGLGLSFTLRAARASGGDVHVCDLPRKGCIFTLDLPRKHPSTVAGVDEGEGSAGSFGAFRPAGIVKAGSSAAPDPSRVKGRLDRS